MKSPKASTPPARRLRTTLAIAFFSLSALVLLLFVAVETFSDFKAQGAVLSSKQQLIAQDAAKTVSSFIHDNFNVLETAAWLSDFHNLPKAEQTDILQSLLGLRPAFRQLLLLNPENEIVAQASRLSMEASLHHPSWPADDDKKKDRLNERKISSVYIDPITYEPLVTMSVPVKDVLRDFKGTLVAELNLKFMWYVVDAVKVGETGYAYVADRQGNLLAFNDTARVLKGENVSQLQAVADFMEKRSLSHPQKMVQYTGIKGTTVVGTIALLNTPDWVVVTELPWKEAYRNTIQNIWTSLASTFLLSILVGLFGMFIAKRLAAPVIDLTETATRIAAGERDLLAAVSGPKEVARLAVAFNSMTAQLRQSLGELEQRFSDLKQTEAVLSLNEERLRLALEGTTDGIWDWDFETGQVYFSPRYYTMMGYEPNAFPASYENWRGLLHPDDVEAAEKAVRRAIEEIRPYAVEFRFRAKDGNWRWILSRGKVVRSDTTGKAIRMAGSHTDITGRKEAEAKIRESERKYRILFDSTELLVSIYDREGTCLLMNRSVANLFGGEPEDFIGKTIIELHAEDGRKYLERVRRSIDSGVLHEYEDEVVFPHGTRWLLSRLQPLPDAQGVFRSAQIISQDFTERKQMEEALRKTKKLLEETQAIAELGGWEYDVAAKRVTWTDEVYRIHGVERDFDPNDLSRDIGFYAPEDAPIIEGAFLRAVESGESYDLELKFIRANGERIWVRTMGKPHLENGRVVRVTGNIMNITERKEVENALRREKQFSDTLIDSMPGVFYVFDRQGRFIRWNKRFETTTGYTTEEIRRMKPTDFFAQEEKEYIAGKIQEVFTMGETEAEAGFTNKSGRTIPHHFTGLRIRIGENPHILGVGIDISERKRAENESVRLQALLKSVILQSPVPMALALDDGTIQLFNEGCRTVLGLEDEPQVQPGMNLFSLKATWKDYDTRGVFIPLSESPLAQALLGKTTRRKEMKVVRKDGTVRWILVDAVPVHGDSGAVMAGFLIFPDITEHKRAEETLLKYERIVSTSQDLMALINRNYAYEAVNESMLKAHNKPREDVEGHKVSEFMGEDVFKEKIKPRMDRAFSGQTVHYQETFHFIGIGRKIMDVNYFPMLDDKEKVIGIVLNARDITETRRLEEQLIQSQKIESIGTLAGGVAHEINNPINGIMNYAQLILDQLAQESPSKKFAQEIIRETRRVAEIVRNLLTFARYEKQSHSPARLSDIISSALSLIQTVMRRDQIDLQLDIPDDLPKMKCRSQQIQQVLMNLMTNARDALNERYPGYSPEKKLHVSVRRIEKEHRKYLRTTVEDTGKGVSAQIRDRIFDPFFTTKPKETGTGLGLSISYGIVTDHGGQLSVESEPGHYTRFHMDLPIDNGWTLPEKGEA